MRAWQRAAVAAGSVAAAGAVAGTGAGTMATIFARRVVTPTRTRPDDVMVVEVTGDSVHLEATPDTLAPGVFGLWWDARRGHARVGAVLDEDDVTGTVRRRLLQVDRGTLRAGPARWNAYVFTRDPAAAGVAFRDVQVHSEIGALPTWLIPAPAPGQDDGVPAGDDGADGTWAVLVHGRGATREECLRAVPVLHRMGMPMVVSAYRNDDEAPASHSGRYGLGDTEWRDVEATVLYALDHGARDVVLVGWSMGGAIVLQLLARSWLADRVRAVILDAPVLDWRDVLDHHARVNRVPAPLGRLGLRLLGSPTARRLVGVDGPVDLRRMDWVTRADELRLPTLVLHSDDDAFVPAGPSRRLAAARPDLVTMVRFSGAAHTREWNVDRGRWERQVADFLTLTMRG